MKIKHFVLIIGLFCVLILGYSVFSSHVHAGTFDVRQLISLANQDRKNSGLNELRENSNLDLAARLKIDDMENNNYFSHVSPQGVNPWYFFKRVDYSYAAAGENLALNYSDPSEVEKAWMNSTEHRENLLNPQFTEVGAAEKEVIYQGHKTDFIVMYFAKPGK